MEQQYGISDFSNGDVRYEKSVKHLWLKGIVFMCMLLSLNTSAQVSTYAFSQSTATYVPLASSTVAFSSTWDDEAGISVPIPFTYTFNGVANTSVFINTNGFLSFGAGLGGVYTPISNNGGTGIISGFGRDLYNGGQPIVYGVEGTGFRRCHSLF